MPPRLLEALPPERERLERERLEREVVASYRVDTSLDIDTGTIEARWPARIEVNATGLIIIAIRVEGGTAFDRDLPRLERAGETLITVVPVYVAPGRVLVTIEALPGLVVLEGAEETVTAWKTVTARRGIVANASWLVRAVIAGESGVVITANRLSEANPEEPLTTQELAALDPDDMRMTLPLQIYAEERSPTTTTQVNPAGSRSWGWIAALVASLLVASLSVTSVFALWLISEVPIVKRRSPRVAAWLGWLPHKLAEFKNLDKGSESSAPHEREQ